MDKKLNRKRRIIIGQLLQFERQRQKLSQTDIAKRTGIRQDTISKMESGDREIDVAKLISYCEVLGLTPMDFALQIESKLHGEGLLKHPKRLYRNTPRETVKIRVAVSWCNGHFSGLFGDNLPKGEDLTAGTFAELKEMAQDCLDSYVKRVMSEERGKSLNYRDCNYELKFKFLDAEALLKAYSPYLSLAAINRVSSVDANLLSRYANGHKKAGAHQLRRLADAIHQIGEELITVIP